MNGLVLWVCGIMMRLMVLVVRCLWSVVVRFILVFILVFGYLVCIVVIR